MNPQTADLIRASLRGALEVEVGPTGLTPRRLPLSALAQSDSDWMRIAAEQASGVRCEFQTAATWIEMTVETTGLYLPWVPDHVRWSVFSATVDGEPVEDAAVTGGSELHLAEPGGPRFVKGKPAVARFELGGAGGQERRVVVWLPQTDTVEIRDVRADAPLAPAEHLDRLRWWHHGSSISQGSDAASPSTTWVALAAAAAALDLTNLGFGGSALLDPFIGRILRDSDADRLSVEIGINLVNADLMRRRAFGPAVHGLLDTIRDGHPATPLVLVSPLYCPIHEDTPGPGTFDLDALRAGELKFRATGDPAEVAAGKLTLTVIRAELARIVGERSDSHLHLVDGLELYGPADHDERPLPDGLHPDAATHRSIGERFAKVGFPE